MLLGRVLQFLGLQLLQCTDNPETGVARFDHIIDVSITCCHIWIGEEVVVLFLFFVHQFSQFLRIFFSANLLARALPPAPSAPITAISAVGQA